MIAYEGTTPMAKRNCSTRGNVGITSCPIPKWQPRRAVRVSLLRLIMFLVYDTNLFSTGTCRLFCFARLLLLYVELNCAIYADFGISLVCSDLDGGCRQARYLAV